MQRVRYLNRTRIHRNLNSRSIKMDELTLINEQCILIKEQGASITNENLIKIFDIILINLNRGKLLKNIEIIQKLVTTISSSFIIDEKLIDINVLDHELFLIFRDSYLNILRQWRHGEILNETSRKIFIELSSMFANICLHATDIILNPLKKLLINKPLIDELNECLDEISTYGKYLKDIEIIGIDNIIRAINYFEKSRMEIQNDLLIDKLLNSIIKCVCSNSFINMFQQSITLEIFHPSETFLLDTCTDYLCWQKDNRYNDICTAIRNALLNYFVKWLENHFSSFQQWTQISIKILGQLYITLINGNAQDDEIYSKDDYDNYCKMIDIFIIIINNIIKINQFNQLTIELIQTITQGLYSLTMTNQLRSYIKSKQIISLLLKLTNINDEIIQFHVYRILASIMTEKDIKTLTNPSTIAYVFLTLLRKLIDDPSMTPRFHNLLRSLKILIQHDQIKEELTKQDVLPLLIRCATETKFNPIKAQQPAIEILLALTFNDEASHQLKQNTEFIFKLKTLINSTTEHSLKRAAENLIWELEKSKSDKSLLTTDVNTPTYDIMLSYSHSDKDLCYRIHDRLIKDQYHVWLDREYMHGATMVAIADAIEKSQFILICMSDTYKQSVYCQSEAHYAFERRRYIIPIIMTSNYRPDGWLGIIASGKIYIDFPKLGFDFAYDKLINEIDKHRKNKRDSILPIEQLQINGVNTTIENDNFKSNYYSTQIKVYPHCIELWTKDHVRSFLINEKLDVLLPVLGNMNGHLLHETWRRCKTSWEMMFQTFKTEVAVDNPSKLLTIEAYIRFIDEIQHYIPIISNDNLQFASKTSVLCTIM